MKISPQQLQRFGLGAVFAWIGVLILIHPEAWGANVQPWAVALLPTSLAHVMFATAILDIVIGVLLALNVVTWIAALVGALHILVVLITCGITDITVRDIGLLFAALATSVDALPPQLARAIGRK